MIIYGTKAVAVTTENIPDACTNCGNTHRIQMTVFQKYAHLFWIPLFPFGKAGATECAHCKQVLLQKEFPAQLRISYDNLKSKSKTPVWVFSGLALFAVLVAAGGINSRKQDAENARWIMAPQKGDIYEIKYDRKHYTLFRVAAVAGDTVFVWPHQFETNRLSGLRALKRKGPDAFVQEPIAFLKTELKTKLESGEIMDIERP
jgi:hypothetical protein